MSRFGRYEVTEELHRSALATVARARGTPIGDPKFVVKTFTPPEFGDEGGDDAGEATFLERAKLQQQVAAVKGSRNWAVVHDVGKQDNAAYFVCDYYPLTAQRLITGRITMTPAALHRLVSAVVRGLRELKAVADRPHGNLKPSNVLIAGQGGDAAGASGVVLADPAPASRLATWGEQADDRVALGLLIHQLVLHRPFRSPGGWPLEKSSEWSALGRFGDGWRDLCNRLLDPTGQQRPADLAEVSRLVARLGSKRGRLVKAFVVLVVAAGALAVGGALVGRQMDQRSRAVVLAANEGWLGELHRRQREQPQVIETYRTDPTLAALLDADADAAKRGVKLDLPRQLPLDATVLDGYRQAHDAAGVVNDLESRLAPDRWPLLKEAAARAEAFRARGWEQPAKELGRVTSAISGMSAGARDASFWRAVDELMALKPHALATNTEAERAWTALEKSLAAPMKKDGDAARVRDAMREQARAGVTLSPKGIAGAERFAPCAAAVDAWAALEKAGYDEAALARELTAAKLTISPAADPAALKAFAARVAPGIAVVKLDAMPEMKAALASFEKTKAFADKDKKSDAERKAYDEAKGAVATQIAKLTSAGGTAAEAQALREAIDAFAKRWSSPSDPTVWLRTATAEPAVTSPALKRAWAGWLKNAGLSGASVVDTAITQPIRQQTDQVRAALLAVDQRFPRTSPELAALPEEFRQAAIDRREEELTRLAATPIKPGEPVPAGLLDINAAKAYQQWVAALTALAKDFPVKEPLLDNPLPRPDEAWATRDATFWQDPRVQDLVRGDVRRLKELAAVGKMTDRAELSAVATGDGVKPEVAMTAWRRLAALDPAWPASLAELEAEAKVQATLMDALATVAAADRKIAEAELAAQGASRWYRAVNTIGAGDSAAADLDRAAALANTFAIPLDALPADAPLTPAARFNLLLRAARAAAAKAPDDAAAAKLAADLRAAIPANLKTSLAPFTADLSKLDRKPFFPAAAKAAGEGKMTLAVPNAPHELEFVRVQAPGVAPFYLCTTEVSLALFLAATGDGAKALLPETPPVGPNVWSWQDGKPAPVLDYWLPGGREVGNLAGFHPDLRQVATQRFVLAAAAGGPPTAEHPLQKVSPAAALAFAGSLGCRLPSPAEWSAALASVKSVTDWNLRDTTWQKQQQHVTDSAARQPPQPGPWPDAGIFVPPGAAVARQSQAKALSSTDNTLFFRPVGPDAGRTFSHLVGNVAEFTFDAPEAFEELADKKPAGVAALLKSRVAAVGVIGGSALSPPEVPTDQPQPVADVTTAYADVGFRLAFSEPAGSPLARLQAVLKSQAFLAPKRE